MRRIWNSFYVLVLSCLFVWAGQTTAVAWLIQQGLTAGEILVVNLLMALAVLGSLALAVPESRRALAGYRLNHLGPIVFCGFLGIYLFNVLYYFALQTNAHDVVPYAIINYLWPLFMLIFGVLVLREKPTGVLYAALACGFVGFLIIQLGKVHEVQQEAAAGDAGVVAAFLRSFGDVTALGCLLAFGGALVWGLFSAVARRISDFHHFEPISSMMLFTLAGTLIALAIHGPAVRWGVVFSQWRFVAVLVFIGAGVNGVTNVFWLRGIQLGGAGRTAVVSYLIPVLGLGYLALFLDQWPRWYSVFGLVLILAAIVLAEYRGRRTPQ